MKKSALKCFNSITISLSETCQEELWGLDLRCMLAYIQPQGQPRAPRTTGSMRPGSADLPLLWLRLQAANGTKEPRENSY